MLKLMGEKKNVMLNFFVYLNLCKLKEGIRFLKFQVLMTYMVHYSYFLFILKSHSKCSFFFFEIFDWLLNAFLVLNPFHSD